MSGQVRRRLLLALPVLLLVAAGCGGDPSTGTPTLAQKDVEGELASQLAASVGRAPEAVRCPDDLPGRVDQQMRCELVDGEVEVGVTVTVTRVEGTDVAFDYVVDDAPVGE